MRRATTQLPVSRSGQPQKHSISRQFHPPPSLSSRRPFGLAASAQPHLVPKYQRHVEVEVGHQNAPGHRLPPSAKPRSLSPPLANQSIRNQQGGNQPQKHSNSRQFHGVP